MDTARRSREQGRDESGSLRVLSLHLPSHLISQTAADLFHHPENSMRRAQRTGFTLIELLLVVAIVGVLAAIAAPKLINSKDRALRSSGISDLHSLIVAQERFYMETGRYGGIADTTALKLPRSPGNTGLAITVSAAGPAARAGAAGFTASLSIPGGTTCGAYVGVMAPPSGMPSGTAVSTPVCW